MIDESFFEVEHPWNGRENKPTEVSMPKPAKKRAWFKDITGVWFCEVLAGGVDVEAIFKDDPMYLGITEDGEIHPEFEAWVERIRAVAERAGQ